MAHIPPQFICILKFKRPAGESLMVITTCLTVVEQSGDSQSGGDHNLFNSGSLMVEAVHKAAGLGFEEEPTVETQEVE